MCKLNRPALLMLVATACACRPTLQGDLEESEANEMLTALLEAGISADKRLQGSGRFAVVVGDDELSAAWRTLRARGLPRRRYQGWHEVYRQRGLLPGRLEERALFLSALQEEIGRTLEAVEGVIFARVHLTAELASERGQDAPPPSASVLVGYAEDTGSRLSVEQVRRLVAHAVAGLSPERVAVVEVFSPGYRAPLEPHRQPLARTLAAGLSAAVFGAAGVWFFWRQRRRGGLLRRARVKP